MITAAIALSASTAGAEVFIPSGAWATFQTVTNEEKKPVCGMQTTFPKDNASIMIKYILGEKGLLVQMFKDSWRFPAEPIDISLIVSLDTYSQSIAARGGVTEGGSPVVQFRLGTGIDDFLRGFSDADLMRLEFPQGDEPRWNARMIGSRKAAQMFKRCVVAIIEANPKTQPYGGGSTQPFGSGKKATQPTQPIAPKRTREDDGSI